jgi:hypothetical protein
VWFPGAGWVPFDPTPPGGVPPARLEDAAGRTGGLLDGLQHRWYKWVVDYNLQRQMDLLQGIGDAFRGGTPRSADLEGWGRRLLVGAALLFLLLAIWKAPRPAAWRRAPPAVRAYLRLRGHYAAHGVPRSGPPLAFLDHLRSAGMAGEREATEAVRLYLTGRFSGEALSPEEMELLEASVRQARRRLRAERHRRGLVPLLQRRGSIGPAPRAQQKSGKDE